METLYWILFVCYVGYAYNRKSVVFSVVNLKKEGMDTSHVGLIVSCQNIAFSISKFLVGIVSDRFNPYLIFATGLLVSGSATLLFSGSSSITAFCCLWFLNGLAQGCGWPSCAKILRQRAPPSEFGTLWSFLSASNNFALSLGPFLSAFILVHYGWRWNMFIAGILTLSLCAFFILSLSFLPETLNKKSTDKKDPVKTYEQTSITALFLDPYMWMLSLTFMVVFCAKTTTVDWGQMYLVEEKRHSQHVASAFTSGVESGGFVGRLAGGYLTDLVVKRNENSKQGHFSKSQHRMFVAMMFMLVNVLSIHLFRVAVSEASSSVWIMSIGALMGFTYYGPIAILGIVSSECVPPQLSGASHAIISLFGNIGATISGLPFSYIAKFYQWSTVFLMLEILTALALLSLVKFRTLCPKIGKAKEH